MDKLKTINFRLTQDEYNLLKNYCDIHNRSMSDVLREKIRKLKTNK
ncbi:DUF6290 family protein [Geminocystis herdmanii]|nr:DUF6290 family protein [Geminocystis herdmanii]